MVGARRTQPVTASGRPKRATTLKKEAEKEEAGEPKSKVKAKEKEKEKQSGNSRAGPSGDKRGNQSRGGRRSARLLATPPKKEKCGDKDEVASRGEKDDTEEEDKEEEGIKEEEEEEEEEDEEEEEEEEEEDEEEEEQEREEEEEEEKEGGGVEDQAEQNEQNLGLNEGDRKKERVPENVERVDERRRKCDEEKESKIAEYREEREIGKQVEMTDEKKGKDALVEQKEVNKEEDEESNKPPSELPRKVLREDILPSDELQKEEMIDTDMSFIIKEEDKPINMLNSVKVVDVLYPVASKVILNSDGKLTVPAREPEVKAEISGVPEFERASLKLLEVETSETSDTSETQVGTTVVTEEDGSAQSDDDDEEEDDEDEDRGSDSDVDDGELEDEADRDFDPDDDPEKLWCFCKKPHGNRFMICCDTCEEWFHGDCIGISMAMGREMEKTGEEWCCTKCIDKKEKRALRKGLSQKASSLVTSPLNTPLDYKKTLSSPVLTKQKDIALELGSPKSLTLESIKSNLARNLSRKQQEVQMEDKDIAEASVPCSMSEQLNAEKAESKSDELCSGKSKLIISSRVDKSKKSSGEDVSKLNETNLDAASMVNLKSVEQPTTTKSQVSVSVSALQMPTADTVQRDTRSGEKCCGDVSLKNNQSPKKDQGKEKNREWGRGNESSLFQEKGKSFETVKEKDNSNDRGVGKYKMKEGEKEPDKDKGTAKEKEKEREREKDGLKLKQRREAQKEEFSLLTFDRLPVTLKKEKDPDTRKKLAVDQRKEGRSRQHSISYDADDTGRKRKKEEKKARSNWQSKSSDSMKQCVRDECQRPVMKGAIYCSRECIFKFANESIKVVEEEKKKEVGKSPEMNKQENMKGTTIICPATSSTDKVSETMQERIAVVEKGSGKVVAGVMAPTKKYLFAWLEEHPTYEVLKPGKQQLEESKHCKNQDEVIRGSVRKSLRDILVQRCRETDMAINHEKVGTLSKKIESELLKMFNNETGQKYKTKYRSLIFNLKDRQNKILYKRVVSGEIGPRQLVSMTPEQLATPELAQWRLQEKTHHLDMVKKREHDDAEIMKKPPIMKTHKGEVVIDEEKVSYETLLEIKSEPSIDRKPKTPAPYDERKDTTEEHAHHLFDSSCKICTGKIVPPGGTQNLGVSTVIQAIPESSGLFPSPQFDETESYVSNSPPTPDTSDITSPMLTPPSASKTSSTRKQPSVWRGYIVMQKVAKFVSTAYAVSGSCESLMDILPDSIHVCGRIPHSQVWDYLGLLREGRKNHYKYLDVIRFEMSSDEEKTGYIKLYTYFYTRQRIGVIGNCYSGIKDIYILPLASHDPIPTELRPLPGLPKPRPHMLLGIIVRVKTSKKQKVPELIDSSPEMVVQSRKKKKKEKKKKDREEKDIDRERAQITLERERVELEAQKKLIDIIFKNRAADAQSLPAASVLPSASLPYSALLSPHSSYSLQHTHSTQLMQSPQSIQRSPQHQPLQGTEAVVSESPQPAETSLLPSPITQRIDTETVTSSAAVSNTIAMTDEQKTIEAQQLKTLREQHEEILQLQSQVQASTITTQPTPNIIEVVNSVPQTSETISIPNPESVAINLRVNVLDQISETIQEVGDPDIPHDGASTSVSDCDSSLASNTGKTKLSEQGTVENIESHIDANNSSELCAKSSVESSDAATLTKTESTDDVRGEEDPYPHELTVQTSSHFPTHTTPDVMSPVDFSPSFTSPSAEVNQAHVQALFGSISNSIAQVQSMLVPDSDDTGFNSSSLEVVDAEGRVNFQPISDPYTEDVDKEVLQDIEQRFELCDSNLLAASSCKTLPVVTTLPVEVPKPSHLVNSGIEDITPPPSEPASPVSSPQNRGIYESDSIVSQTAPFFTYNIDKNNDSNIDTGSQNKLYIDTDTSPVTTAATLVASNTGVKQKKSYKNCNSPNTIGSGNVDSRSSSGSRRKKRKGRPHDDDEQQQAEDDYARDLLEDIEIPANIPRRATLFNMELIKMRQGIKMPELPDIKLPVGKEAKVVQPPIPSAIPMVPINPDILSKLPPGVPFPPMPPAPPPSTGVTAPVSLKVDDRHNPWEPPSIEGEVAVQNQPLGISGSHGPSFHRRSSQHESAFQPFTRAIENPISLADNQLIARNSSQSEVESDVSPYPNLHSGNPSFVPPLRCPEGVSAKMSSPSFSLDMQAHVGQKLNEMRSPVPPGPMPQRPSPIPGVQGMHQINPRQSTKSAQRCTSSDRVFEKKFSGPPHEDFSHGQGSRGSEIRPTISASEAYHQFKYQATQVRGHCPGVQGNPRLHVPVTLRPRGPDFHRQRELAAQHPPKPGLICPVTEVERTPTSFEPRILQFRQDGAHDLARRAPFVSDRPRPPSKVNREPPPFEADRLQAPFESEKQRSPLKPDIQRPLFEPDRPQSIFESDRLRPPFEPNREQSHSEGNRPSLPFETDRPRPHFEPGRSRPPFEPVRPRPPFEPVRPRPPFEYVRSRPPFESDRPRPPFESDRSQPFFQQERLRPPLKPERPRTPFELERPQLPFQNSRPRYAFEPGKSRAPTAPDSEQPRIPRPLFDPNLSTHGPYVSRPFRPPNTHVMAGGPAPPLMDLSFTEEVERHDGSSVRNNRKKYPVKDRSKFKYPRHTSFGERRSPPRHEFSYHHNREKGEGSGERSGDRYVRDDGPSKAKQSKRILNKPNKYSCLATPSELEELEEGEVL